MNSLILFLSHSIWIVLALATIGYGLRDVVAALRSHFAAQNQNFARPVLAPRAKTTIQRANRNLIYSH